MFYPSLTVQTGTPNNTQLLVDRIFNLIKLPTFDVSQDKNFHWSICRNWEYRGTWEDIQYCHEGFDKVGYLRIFPGGELFQVKFIPKSKRYQPSKLSAIILLGYFACFLKKHIPGMPHEIYMNIE